MTGQSTRILVIYPVVENNDNCTELLEINFTKFTMNFSESKLFVKQWKRIIHAHKISPEIIFTLFKERRETEIEIGH